MNRAEGAIKINFQPAECFYCLRRIGFLRYLGALVSWWFYPFLNFKIGVGFVGFGVVHPVMATLAVYAGQAVGLGGERSGGGVEAVIMGFCAIGPPFAHFHEKRRGLDAFMHVKAARGQERIEAFKDALGFIAALADFLDGGGRFGLGQFIAQYIG